MDNRVKELKEVIYNLKLELVKTKVYKGSCPYSLYTPLDGKFDCSIGCDKCREVFMENIRKSIRQEVNRL